MDHPEGAGLQRADRVDFDPRVRLEFRGTQLSSDGGLLVMRELDDALGLSDLAGIGEDVGAGDPLCMVHAATEAQADEAIRTIQAAYVLAASPPDEPDLILKRIS